MVPRIAHSDGVFFNIIGLEQKAKQGHAICDFLKIAIT